MNKKALVVIGIIVALLLIGGGAFAYYSNQNDKDNQEKMAMEKKAEDEAMMEKEESTAMEKEKTATESDSMSKEDVMSKQGVYVTLADYNGDQGAYSDTKKVYFFHASWCPICQAIEKEINNDITKLPAGVTLIKTDFDSNTELRQKYGETTQYTFVQVDENGNETKQWSASSL